MALLGLASLASLGGAFKVSEFEYWGSHVPLVFVLLAIAGIVLARQRETLRSDLTPLLVIVVIAAILTLNPFNGPITLIRRLPMGTGFRVSGRFLPFFYFVLLVPAAFGIDVLLSHNDVPAIARAAPFHLEPRRYQDRRLRRDVLPLRVREESALFRSDRREELFKRAHPRQSAIGQLAREVS